MKYFWLFITVLLTIGISVAIYHFATFVNSVLATKLAIVGDVSIVTMALTYHLIHINERRS